MPCRTVNVNGSWRNTQVDGENVVFRGTWAGILCRAVSDALPQSALLIGDPAERVNPIADRVPPDHCFFRLIFEARENVVVVRFVNVPLHFFPFLYEACGLLCSFVMRIVEVLGYRLSR